MKRAIHYDIGDPSKVLTVEDVDPIAPCEGEAQVEVLASPINPSDLLKIAGRYGVQPKLPEVPGGEAIGRVVEVGTGVSDLTVGQQVLIAAPVGKWQQVVTVPTRGLIPLPDGGDPQQLSMLAVNPMTALLMIEGFVDLQPGDWIVQSAANSAVGNYMIQLAKQRGVKTVNVVRRSGLTETLKALGADTVVVADEDLTEKIKVATGGEPVRLAIDPVGGATFSALVASLAPGGTGVSYGVLAGEPAPIDLGSLISNDIHVRGFWLYRWYQTASTEAKQSALGKLVPLILQGVLHTPVAKTFGIDEVSQAVALAAEGERDGKIMLLPNGSF